MTRPAKPNITIPESFATNGRKTDFSAEKILNGFDPINPDILSGDNLNKLIDDTFKGLNYSIDSIDELYKGAVIYDSHEIYNLNSLVFHVDSNNKTHMYRSLSNNNSGNNLSNTSYWKEIIIDSSDLVLKSGDTMTGQLKNNEGFSVVHTNITRDGSTPSAGSLKAINFYDNSSSPKRLGLIENAVETSGKVTTSIYAYKNQSNNEYARIEVGFYSGGSAFCIFPKTTCVDGQWVNSFHSLSTATAQGNYEIDISSHLPNDSFSYEVMVVFAGFRTGGDSNTVVNIAESSTTITSSTDIALNPVYGITEFDGNHGECGEIMCNVIVGSSRKFYYNVCKTNLSTASLIMTKYRRIGTNG